jgi:uncharacterized protein YfcZ (UPF0381/DUF406 family)
VNNLRILQRADGKFETRYDEDDGTEAVTGLFKTAGEAEAELAKLQERDRSERETPAQP